MSQNPPCIRFLIFLSTPKGSCFALAPKVNSNREKEKGKRQEQSRRFKGRRLQSSLFCAGFDSNIKAARGGRPSLRSSDHRAVSRKPREIELGIEDLAGGRIILYRKEQSLQSRICAGVHATILTAADESEFASDGRIGRGVKLSEQKTGKT